MSYDTSDIRKGLKIMMDGAPYTVVEFQFVKPGKGAAFTRTKMKNLLTGGVLERNLRSGERLEPADVETKTMQYLYADADSFVFMDTTTYDQVQIPRETVGDQKDFMPENTNVEVLFFNGRAVDVSLPNFIEQPIIEADPGFRGDTATGATKPVKIPTGASINVPLFISVGDVIKIDTRSGQYLERVGRKVAWPRRRRRWQRAPASCAPFVPGSRGRGSSRSRRRRACARPGRRSTSTRSRRGPRAASRAG